MKLYPFTIMMLLTAHVAWAESIDEQCLALGYIAPSPKPTPSPTLAPTASPTVLPSPSPSPSLSPSPTAVPSPKPSPSVAPSPSPTTDAQGEDDTCRGLDLKRWPQDVKGWTIFPTAQKTIFVSASAAVPAGAPANSFGVKTLADGLKLLEKGKHQHLLFKRGEVFEGGSLDSKLSGLDADHLMVIGAYGSGLRPKLTFKGDFGLVASNAGSNVAMVDLDLDGYQGKAHAGIRTVQSSGQNLLIEGVRIAGFQNGIAADYQSPDEKPAFTNLVVRRSVIIDSFARAPAPGQEIGHSQGIYVAKAKGLLIEETFFDHNGWKNLGNGEEDRKQSGPGMPTIFNHNLYLQSEGLCYVYRKNVSLRGSATGLQLRPGGVVEDSLFAMNPNQINFGAVNGGSVQALHIPPGVSGRIVRNVMMDEADITPALPRDGQSTIGNILHAVIADNIITRQGSGFEMRGFSNGVGIHSLSFRSNLFFQMGSSVVFNGPAWGPVSLKAEMLTGADENNKTVTRSAASVFLPNGTRVMDGLTAGIAGRFAPRSIADAGTVLDGNIFQTTPTSFLKMGSPPKPFMQLKNMQQANVQFVDPSRKMSDLDISRGRSMERNNWDESLLAPAKNAGIRAGFMRKN
jgi:hypothetical protein